MTGPRTGKGNSSGCCTSRGMLRNDDRGRPQSALGRYCRWSLEESLSKESRQPHPLLLRAAAGLMATCCAYAVQKDVVRSRSQAHRAFDNPASDSGRACKLSTYLDSDDGVVSRGVASVVKICCTICNTELDGFASRCPGEEDHP
jgi:hypothetical protein